MVLKFEMDSLSIGKNIFCHFLRLRRHSRECTIHSENVIFDEKHKLVDSPIKIEIEDFMHLEENVHDFDKRILLWHLYCSEKKKCYSL